MKYDLLKDEKNLSTIIGHVGCHKKTYNKFLEKELKNILDYWDLTGNAEKTNSKVMDLIVKIKNSVGEGMANNLMNNKKLYILN